MEVQEKLPRSNITLILSNNPNFEFAQCRFMLSCPEYKHDIAYRKEFLKIIKQNQMTPWYEDICRELNWTPDVQLLESMRMENARFWCKLTGALQFAILTHCKEDTFFCLLDKADFLCSIGDKAAAEYAYNQAYENAWQWEQKIDIILQIVRLGLFHANWGLVKCNLGKAHNLLAEVDDWDRHIRLYIYEGVYAMACGDFKKAAQLLMPNMMIFHCADVMTYTKYLRFAVYMAMFSYSRRELHEQIILNVDLRHALKAVPDVDRFLNAMFSCEYRKFFKELAKVEKFMRKDFLMHTHYRSYIKGMNFMAYSQLLSAYQSLKISYVADMFGLTAKRVEQDLRTFILENRISAKIDRVAGVVNVQPNKNVREKWRSYLRQDDYSSQSVRKLGH